MLQRTGLVHMVVPKEIYPIVAGQLTEPDLYGTVSGAYAPAVRRSNGKGHCLCHWMRNGNE